MREIKFRGFTRDNKDNLYKVVGDLSIAKNCDKRNAYPQGTQNGDCFISNSAGSPFAYKVIPKTVGQYIGVKDKNGKEIYENDLLKSTEGYNEQVYIVKYLEEACAFILPLFNRNGTMHVSYLSVIPGTNGADNLELEGYIVIGNIYETPELIGD